ncbi:MAG: YfhO family protein [Ruminococcus sp.]|nr:YfhO family protein [Ruminococcus sp.]
MNDSRNKLSFRYDAPAVGALVFMTLMIIFSISSADTVYGSKTDWASQHYAIPEYFRTLFYDTGQLIPSYAPNSGGGENMFNLSYYGLLSPLILPSYLLPSVPMGTYIIVTSVAAALVSECELYFLLRRRYSSAVSLLSTVFFALSVPLILNTHRQIMFTSFMPFLLMSLHGAESFFKSGKKTILASGVFLMVMCNYYFAPSAVIAVFMYGIWLALGEEPKSVFKKLLPFSLCIFAGICASAVLILPTAYGLFANRGNSGESSVLKMLVPELRIDKLTYYNSPMGLSAFGVFAALYFLVKGGRQQRFVSATVLSFAVFPVTLYILNGTLYTDPKVLFPFLPMALTLTADMLNVLPYLKSRKTLALFISFSVIAFFTGGMTVMTGAYLVDAFIVAVGISLCIFTHKRVFISAFFAVPIFVCLFGNHYDKLTSRKSYETVNSSSVTKLISELPDDELYRTAVDTERLYSVNKIYSPRHYSDTVYSSLHSQDYNNFYFNEMFNENEFRNSALTVRSKNPFFNSFMGDRYYISNRPVSFYGFELADSVDGFDIYVNKNAFPLAYVRDDIMSERQYRTLVYPDNIAALLNYTIVPTDVPDVKFCSGYEKVDISDIFDSAVSESVGMEKVISTENGRAEFEYVLPESVRGKLLLLRFNVADPSEKDNRNWENKGDIRITINGVRNTLSDPSWKYHNCNNSFEYVISDMSDKLDIVMTGEDIRISGIDAYVLPPEKLSEPLTRITPFIADMSETHGDVISGTISHQCDSIVCTSFVMHEGFRVWVDGEETVPVKVDTAFLGFPVKSGSHRIVIKFTAPMLGVGKSVSLIGILLLLIFAVNDIIMCKKIRTS